MSKKSRSKGIRGESEFRDQLSAELGDWVPARRLDATREGGEDFVLEPWCIEVKRSERLCLQSWWEQACQQAADTELLPALAYRANRQPWRIIVPISADNWLYEYTLTCNSVAGFAQIVRESRVIEMVQYEAAPAENYAIH